MAWKDRYKYLGVKTGANYLPDLEKLGGGGGEYTSDVEAIMVGIDRLAEVGCHTQVCKATKFAKSGVCSPEPASHHGVGQGD